MRIAYGDLIGGVSGDMFVAALLDLGLPLAKLTSELKKIPTLQFKLEKSQKTVHGIRASRFHVVMQAVRAVAAVNPLSSMSWHPELSNCFPKPTGRCFNNCWK